MPVHRQLTNKCENQDSDDDKDRDKGKYKDDELGHEKEQRKK